VVRFVHSADWQLGRAPYYLNEDAGPRFRTARVEVIGTIAELAVRERCDFVVVCGDVFESNRIDRQVLVRALDKMRAAAPLEFFLLPGNHDPLDASSIFGSPTFKEHGPSNVTVLDGREPVQAVPGVELIAAPWPNKRPLVDLVGEACQSLEPTDVLRVVCGHGAVDAMWPESSDPAHISLERLEERIESDVIHYVGLGDRHSTTDVGDSGRVWYSGAPEPTDFDEIEPGNVLVVDLDRNGVRVGRHRVGTWRFEDRDWELGTDLDIDALRDWLESPDNKERCIVRTTLRGQVSVAQRARLHQMFAHYTLLFGGLEVREGGLAVVPDDADLDDFGVSGYAREALSDLSEIAQSGDRAVIARDALALLYRLTRAPA
jgi:DNA repair exonuclease SbcCD nuclease subunit